MNTLKAIGLAIIAVFAPAKAMLLTVLVLVVVDLIVGIMAARKRKERITSRGMRRTITKLFIYEVAIGLAFLTQAHLTGDIIPVSNIVAGLVGITELTSVMEKLNALSGDKLLQAAINSISSSTKHDAKVD